jgi:hypothetical protein
MVPDIIQTAPDHTYQIVVVICATLFACILVLALFTSFFDKKN